MKNPKPPSDYDVGYGKPPISHRWRKGQSGNPLGGTKKLVTIAATLRSKLRARVTVNEAGRRRSMTMQDLILESLIRDAAQGDARSRLLLFSIIARYDGTDATIIDPANLSGSDQDLIDAFLAANAGAPIATPDSASSSATRDTKPANVDPSRTGGVVLDGETSDGGCP